MVSQACKAITKVGGPKAPQHQSSTCHASPLTRFRSVWSGGLGTGGPAEHGQAAAANGGGSSWRQPARQRHRWFAFERSSLLQLI